MKRIALVVMVASLCLCLVATASASCGTPTVPTTFTSTIFMPQWTTEFVGGTFVTRTDSLIAGSPCTITRTECPQIQITPPTFTCPQLIVCDLDLREPYLQAATVCCENYRKLANASANSGKWAKYGLKVLKQVLKQTGVDWIVVKSKTHTPSNNGWVELNLRNTKTGEELYCIMNLHTRGDGAKSDRVCTFTYGHLVNPSKGGKVAGVCWEITPCFTRVKSEITTTGGLKLADYPACYVIGEVGEEPETAIANFVYWLAQDINHAMPLESLAVE